jgi:hypothetical protein
MANYLSALPRRRASSLSGSRDVLFLKLIGLLGCSEVFKQKTMNENISAPNLPQE